MQRGQLKGMIYVSPHRLLSLSQCDALPEVVGGFMMILQQFIVNYVVRQTSQKVREKEFAKNP